MRYNIKLTTYDPHNTAEHLISKALGFDTDLSKAGVIDLFAVSKTHKNGVFTSKKEANRTAERINGRGMFGGYGEFGVFATVYLNTK